MAAWAKAYIGGMITILAGDLAKTFLNDGLGLLRAVRSCQPLKNLAFIILTGRADIDLVAQVRQLGVNNYRVKPFKALTLKTKVEGVFGVIE